MSLIRICDAANLNKWDKDSCDPEAIIKEWFGPALDPDKSVFMARSEREEVEITAALSLTDLKSLKPVHLLRIEPSDLHAIGAIQWLSEKTPGETGVVRVDYLHRELVKAKDYLTQLVERIWERYEAGEQRFRWLGKPVLRRQLRLYLSLPDREVIQEAKRRCRHKIDAPGGGLSAPRAGILQKQLEDAPPNIPAWVIRERAYRLYQRLGRHDAVMNWLEAERELLTEYNAGFLRYAPPAF